MQERLGRGRGSTFVTYPSTHVGVMFNVRSSVSIIKAYRDYSGLTKARNSAVTYPVITSTTIIIAINN